MKRLIIVSVLSIFMFVYLNAQENSNGKTITSFSELNVGIAQLTSEYDVFPGVSYLWGKTVVDENNFIVEYEAGFALPTIITGKVGIGKKFDNTHVIVGLRPYPFNLYFQASLMSGNKGYWIMSVEYNPVGSDSFIFFESRALFNIGYRWYLNK
ncbi:hypothetical protein [Winogradskyella alexanderae]|uniref:DUF3859 domain-containing protein n=1 Tax=Winogradskyella alexanderae TaxID=2877123 RepID=A0ABS7XQY3_9FLAO|nr:hypothetical protein [Winogradskyella alexanderae]MCA0131814.1 hypothetical protein [Winogradskyella alexanderae]